MESGPTFTLDGYRDLIESLGVAVMVGSATAGVLLCNQKACDLTGMTREALMASRATDPVWRFVREDGSPMPVDEYPALRVYRTGRPVDGLVFGVVPAHGGEVRWVLAHAEPRRDPRLGVDIVVATFQEITSRRQIQSALQESEARYRAIFENSPYGILIADPETQGMRYANRTICRLLGYAQDEMVGMSLGDLHPASDLERVRAGFLAQAAGLVEEVSEVPCLRKNGTIAWFDVRSHLVTIDGTPHVVGMFHDLSERQRADRALREFQALQATQRAYRSVLEDQTEIIARFGPDGALTFVNEVFCRFFGKSRDELVGSRWQPVAVDEDVPHVEEQLARLGPANPVVLIENRVYSGTGEVRWFQFVNRAFFDDAGQMLEMQAVGRDITDRRKAEEELARYREHLVEMVHQRTVELAQSEERYRRLVEASPEAILVHADGRVLYANPAATTVLRAESPSLIVGRTVESLVHPDGRDTVLGRIRAVYEQGTPAPRLEQVIVGLDGSDVDVDVQSAPITYDARPAAMSVIRDITVQRQLEREMRNSQKLESVGLLAGGIAHDFNNLLSAILGNISLARIQPAGSGEADERLVHAERAVQRAISLTRQLLTFARGGAPVRQAALLQTTIVDTADFALRGSNVACRYDIALNLRAADVDVGQVSQVIHNVVVNSQQAMPEGGTLHIQAENADVVAADGLPLRPGPYVRIAIRDTGIGILPEHREKIFDPYFTTKAKGSGLGLAVCHSIVRQHGGLIRVESVVGRGTTFVLYFPAADRPPVQDPPPDRPLETTGRNERVLLMDDDPDILFVLARILKTLGYVADTVTDGRQALDRYSLAMRRGEPYAAVIVDLTVPGGMGGKEALGRLLEIDPDAAVIVSSGYSNDPILADHAAHGFRGVLAKPYHVSTVAGVLRQVIESRRSHRPPPGTGASS